MMLSTFHSFHLYIFLVRCWFRSFTHFVLNLFAHHWALWSWYLPWQFKYYHHWVSTVCCIFWIQVPYQMCVLQVFSQSVACFFIFLTLSFAEKKLLIFTKFDVSIFPFIDWFTGMYLKIHLQILRSPRFSHVISWKFLQFSFIFRSVIILS